MKNEHVIEPELRQTPPRQIKNKGGFWGVVKPFFWVLLPHTWIAVASPVVFAWLLLAYYCPEVKTTGTVIRHYVTTNRRGEKSPHVIYTYTAKGIDYQNNECVAADVYGAIEKGNTTLPVSASRNPLGRGYIARIAGSSLDSSPFVFGALWCTIWCGVVGTIAWSSCSVFLRSNWLVRCGVPVEGAIVATRIKKGSKGAQIPIIEYSYEAKTGDGGMYRAQPKTGEMRLAEKQFNDVRAGDVVTVLYDEKRPKCSIVYKYAEHQACM